MIAVMAHQSTVRRMIGQGYAAAGTFRHMAALSTQKHPAIAAAVQKQDALLAALQIFLQLLPQFPTDEARISVPDLLTEVRDGHLRETVGVIALPQQHLAVMSFLRRPGRFNGGGGGAQDQSGAVSGAEVFGDVPGVIAGGILRLVASLLLLVQDHQTQMLQRRKNG